MNDTWAPNKEEYEAIEKIANSADDGPILMINIKNLYFLKCIIMKYLKML